MSKGFLFVLVLHKALYLIMQLWEYWYYLLYKYIP